MTSYRTAIGAACAALALLVAAPAGAHDVRETVTPNFAQAIPNIPGKSLVAVVVEYAPGAAVEHFPSMIHQESLR